MSVGTWRRFHGRFLAEVVTRAQVYRVVISDTASGVSRELPRAFDRLEAAKAAADDAIRRVFSHRCGMETCGLWLQWTV